MFQLKAQILCFLISISLGVVGFAYQPETFSEEPNPILQLKNLSQKLFHEDSFSSRKVDLIKWALSSVDDRDHRLPSYDRRSLFGGWLRIGGEECNTRGAVLIRDSQEPVQMDSCVVRSGLWKDKYSGLELQNPSNVQVDHLVPLHNVYYSGAAEWEPERRCHYTNFLDYQDHLQAIRYDENIRKGAKAPHQYIPPNNEYQCNYLKQWLQIKAIWSLSFKSEEIEAIQELRKELKCRSSSVIVSYANLMRLREKAQTIPTGCAHRPRFETEGNLEF